MKKFILILVLLFTSLSYANEKKILAVAGDIVITDEDLNRIIEYYEPDRKRQIQENPEMKLAVLKQIVANTLVYKIAEEKKFLERPEIKEQLKLVMEHFVTSAFLKDEVIKNITVNEDEAKNYYQININDFVEVPEQVRARHILFRLPQNANEEERKKVLERAESIIKLLKEGADFGELAKIHSDDPGSKAKGGDLGFFSRGRMVKPFEDTAFSLKVGEISSPIQTNFGIHIIKVEEKKEAKYKPFEKIREQVIKKATEEKQKQAVLRYMEELFKNKKVIINEDLILKK
ncbi:MAG: peptidylprolyl isomerase [Proteobacteria bacterium]|nr:peptidylprolyl isomerase [Pseudomonadota bacterium]